MIERAYAHRVLSLLVTLAITFGLFAAMPMTAWAALSSDATLSSLDVTSTFDGSTVSLSPGFSATTYSYTTSVGNNVTGINITAQAVASAGVTAGNGSHNLNEGQNVITVTVTAEDGTTQNYIITVTRAAANNNGGNTSTSKSKSSSSTSSSVPTLTVAEGITIVANEIRIDPAKVKDFQRRFFYKEAYAQALAQGYTEKYANAYAKSISDGKSAAYAKAYAAAIANGKSTAEADDAGISAEKQYEAKSGLKGSPKPGDTGGSAGDVPHKSVTPTADERLAMWRSLSDIQPGKAVDGVNPTAAWVSAGNGLSNVTEPVYVPFNSLQLGYTVGWNADSGSIALNYMQDGGLMEIKDGSVPGSGAVYYLSAAVTWKPDTQTITAAGIVADQNSTSLRKGDYSFKGYSTGSSLNLSLSQNFKEIAWNNPTKPVIVYMSHELKNADPNALVMYDKKTGKTVAHSFYRNGYVWGAVTGSGNYGVRTAAVNYADVAQHPAKNDIIFAAARGLISGTGDETFSPDKTVTRAEFIMALVKLSGADVSKYKKSSFTDVKSDDPAMPYIEWAAKNGIDAGIGNNKFGPSQAITREQMAVMMMNYANATNQTLPVIRKDNIFADNANISNQAAYSVMRMQWAGVMEGKSGNVFNPQGASTRAQACTILRKFAQVLVNGIKGWVQDNAGNWYYVKNNYKLATGWMTDSTGGSYFFDENGVRVHVYKDIYRQQADGHEVSADGARK